MFSIIMMLKEFNNIFFTDDLLYAFFYTITIIISNIALKPKIKF